MANCEWIRGDAEVALGEMPDKYVDLVLTDPPYDFEYEKKKYFQQQFWRLSRGSVIVFCPPENQWWGAPDQYLFWIKPISTKNTSKSYSRFVEMICVWNGGAWNANRHWSQYTNVFMDLVDDSKVHPYRKPPSLIERLILNHTNAGDKVLDAFAGSGVVAEVCKRLGRNSINVEIDEKYSR